METIRNLLIAIAIAVTATAGEDDGAVSKALQYCKQHETRFVNDLKKLVAIPSIASMPAHKKDMVNAANQIKKRLTAAGLEHAMLLSTSEHPAVYADWLHNSGAPTVLIYGHYDVQPADPFKLWNTPPFKPTVIDGEIFGRGVDDMKGNLLLSIQAAESVLKTSKSLPVNVKFLFEGEEEVGSTHFKALLEANRDLLTADLALSADGGQISPTQPSLCLGLRGIVSLEVHLQTLKNDVHSGLLGGAVLNSALALARLLSTLHTTDGKINIEGFYDDVAQMSGEDRADVLSYGADTSAMLSSVGAMKDVGEEGFGLIERTWYRPSLDVVGMESGVQGQAMKTIIPAVALAKISSRLVPNQDPEKVILLITRHLEDNCPVGANISITLNGFAGYPFTVPRDTPGQRAAAKVLTRLMGAEPRYERSGGSIGALAHLQSVMGIDTTLFGFGLADNNGHAPNERYQLSMYNLGRQAYVHVLYQLAQEFKELKQQEDSSTPDTAGDTAGDAAVHASTDTPTDTPTDTDGEVHEEEKTEL